MTWRIGVVRDLRDGVEAQPVDPVLPHPELRVLDRPLAHAGLGVVESLSPGRLAEPVGEVRAERAQPLVPGADVVVDDVEHDAESLAVRGVDEPRQARRAAVGRVRGEGIEPVVAPAAVAREGRDRHQLDRSHTELAQAGEARDDAVERSFRRERADVELVEDEVVERERRPGSDVEGAGIEQARGAAHALGLPTRAGVRPGVAAVEDEAVVVAGSSGSPSRPEPVADLAQRVVAGGEAYRNRARVRSPDAKLDRPGSDRHGAEQRSRGERHLAGGLCGPQAA